MVPPELWDHSSPRGRESKGPQMGGTGHSERMSTYLASSGVPEPHPATLAFRGQDTGSKEPLRRLVGGGRGGSGQREWLSTPPTYVSESSLVCTAAHLFLFHPLNGMFHLPWKPRGRKVIC